MNRILHAPHKQPPHEWCVADDESHTYHAQPKIHIRMMKNIVIQLFKNLPSAQFLWQGCTGWCLRHGGS